MEKQKKRHNVTLFEEPSTPGRNSFVAIFRGAIAWLVLTLAATALSLFLLNSPFHSNAHFHYPPTNDDTSSTTNVVTPLNYEWSKIVPSPDLKWHVCGERRECARIELPMDHFNPSNGEKVAIGLVRIPATHKEYRGPIMIGAGVPGKSGILLTHMVGDVLQKVVGPEYDIVGVDPRGIGASTPKILNHPNDIERAIWRARDPPLINLTKLPEGLPLLYSRADMFGQLALHSPSSHAAEYVGTVATARDIVNITEAFGFDKVNFWGLSYGSTLGGTLAAMFPDRVGRIILDGAMEFSDYYSGRWMNSLKDIDKIISYVFEACVAAGPKDCPLYASTPANVELRFDAIFLSFMRNPFPVFDNSTGDYAIIEYANAKLVFYNALNNVFSGRMEALFEALAALEKGNGVPLMRMLIRAPPPKCDGGSTQSDVLPTEILDGAFAIRCGDTPLEENSYEEVLEYLKELREVSVFADIWSQVRIGCSGWRIKAKERYEGGFNKNTSFPLLVIGNTLDAVTPWAGSKKVSEGFSNSVFMTIDSPGTNSLGAGMSPVAIKHIRNYFRDGILPPAGTVCPIESTLFVKNNLRSGLYDRELKGEDREIWELAEALAQGVSEAIANGMDALNGWFL